LQILTSSHTFGSRLRHGVDDLSNQQEGYAVSKIRIFLSNLPRRVWVGVVVFGVLVALVITGISNSGKPPVADTQGTTVQDIANSKLLGDAIGRGVKPATDDLANRDNETRAAVKKTTARVDSLAARFEQSVKDIEALQNRTLQLEDVTKGIQEQLKALPEKAPLSRLEKLEREVADLRLGFPHRATA
jgi:hypothetical protein